MTTAKEFLIEKGYNGFAKHTEVPVWMIEFAKLHVVAALNAASENASTCKDSAGNDMVDEDSILSAYPLENIL
jgi:hypothetical protein